MIPLYLYYSKAPYLSLSPLVLALLLLLLFSSLEVIISILSSSLVLPTILLVLLSNIIIYYLYLLRLLGYRLLSEVLLGVLSLRRLISSISKLLSSGGALDNRARVSNLSIYARAL